jgi:uncharacterized repeat protein (TIGR03803 family)
MTKLNAWEKAGVIFLLCAAAATGAPAQVFTKLADFDGTNGASPAYMSLTQGQDGKLYGTDIGGGAEVYGTVFRVTLEGDLTTIHSFCSQEGCSDGRQPGAGLVLDAGSFWGETIDGGAQEQGTLFKITPSGTLTTLHIFDNTDGESPYSGLVLATDGNFYGTTLQGGISNVGTVFKITAGAAFTTIHRFGAGEGSGPVGALVQATDGNFYGTTQGGGSGSSCPGGCGTVFKVTPGGTLTTLHSFDTTDGNRSISGLVQATDGNLYGTTLYGGNLTCNVPNGCGTLFKITLGGALTTLYVFSGPDGGVPQAPLIQATDGNLYGTTGIGGTYNNGTVFSLAGERTLTTLHSFDGTDGTSPQGGLLQATDGNFYGTTPFGGADNEGTVFSLNMGLGPFVAFVRSSGKVGQSGGILGHGFTGTTSVSLNGIPASFTVVSDTFIRATVPAGATTGYVTVVTPSGTLTSNVQFRVLQ